MNLLTRSIAAIAISASAAAAQVNVQWLQPSNGNWFDPLNWQQLGTNPPIHVVPNGPLDSAFITTPESSVVTLDSGVTLDRFTLTAPNTLLGAGSLTTRTFDHTGMISGGMSVRVTEEFSTWTGQMHSATLSVSGRASGFLILPVATNIPTNTAQIQFHDDVRLQGFYARQGAFQLFPDDALMSNFGTLTNSGTASFTTTPFYNDANATVIADADFSMHNAARGGGTFIANAGARLLIGGTAGLDAQTTVRGEGTIILYPDGRVRFPVQAAAIDIPTARAVLEQELNARSYLGLFTSSAGSLSGQRVVLDAGGVGRLGGSGSFDVSRISNLEIVNRGSMLFSSGIQADGPSTFTNSGVVVVSGPGAVNRGVRIQNQGEIRVEAGTLTTSGEIHGAGKVSVSSGATLHIQNLFSPAEMFFTDGTLDCRGSLYVTTVDTPIRIGASISHAEVVRTEKRASNQHAYFDGDVSANQLIGMAYTRIQGEVQADTIEGGFEFHKAVTASSFNGAATFHSGTSTFDNARFNGQSVIDGFMLVRDALVADSELTINGWLVCEGTINADRLIKAGVGTLIVRGPSVAAPGAHDISVELRGGNSFFGGDLGATRVPTLTVQGSTTSVTFESSQHFRESFLTSGKIRISQNGGRVLRVKAGPGSSSVGTQIDLADNTFVMDYTAMSPFTDIALDTFIGYANGSWNGPGIYSSVAGGNSEVGIGVAEASAIFSSFPATIAGETVDSTTVIARYTLRGDANLDRTVDIRDFALLAPRFNTSGFWHHGDFNYDFTVNVADFAIMAANFNRTMSFGDGSRGAAVPEPTIATVGLLAAVALRRR